LADLLDHHHQPVEVLVVGHPDGPHHPVRVQLHVEVQVVGEVPRPSQLPHQPAQVARQHGHLLLLDLHRQRLVAFDTVQQEHPVADRAGRAHREPVRCGHVEIVTHDSSREVRESTAFTHSTCGPPGPYRMAVTEHGDTTNRWNRSSGTPAAPATTALIGSAWDTATTDCPGWAATSRNTASVARVAISANDSPPGNRKPAGQCRTFPHSLVRASRFSELPVHRPMSHSNSPASVRTRSPSALAIGAAVSLVLSSGDAYTAAGAVFSPAIRSAARSACPRPASDRWSPAFRPGSTAPVVGVRPWRTSSTVVGFGGVGTGAHRRLHPVPPDQPTVSRKLAGRSDGRRGVQLAAQLAAPLAALEDEITGCRACPRLVAWRE